ncbi:protein of unknown function [Candidatus Nitrospira inopinata]|uniref:Uncharacterized protein n=1 Tax=Candidatus Nitrospira inopinata TaxID=1715989 RepID=A0A0S4KSS4_9BACT|nr:protein of unknown function [Candidatus Nitrospira inopinata]
MLATVSKVASTIPHLHDEAVTAVEVRPPRLFFIDANPDRRRCNESASCFQEQYTPLSTGIE